MASIELYAAFIDSEFLIDSDTVALNFSNSFEVAFHLRSHFTSYYFSPFIYSRYYCSFSSLLSSYFLSLLISPTAITFSSLIMLVIFSVLFLSAWRALCSFYNVLKEASSSTIYSFLWSSSWWYDLIEFSS